ncbi:unnamed protein product [Rhizoctonia solani]|uniref:Uncharacterized protein n=1 Tax=Rhizoctonia solani TaxID=456999 RepID=A0A8H2WT71_9AGAM|nr:unnamed protein product [Rhizoctonia solani]
MARRLFEEWTGNAGAEESDGAEPEEEHLDDENPVDEHLTDHEPNVPVADEHTDVPKVHSEPEEPPSGIVSGDSHGSHEEASQPPAPAPAPVTSDSNQEVEPTSEVGDEKDESKGAENEKVEEKAEPSSTTDAIPNEAARPQSPVKEPEAKEGEKPKEIKPEADSGKAKDDGEEPKDKDTADH